MKKIHSDQLFYPPESVYTGTIRSSFLVKVIKRNNNKINVIVKPTASIHSESKMKKCTFKKSTILSANSSIYFSKLFSVIFEIFFYT